MGLVELFLTAVGLSMDAFAVSVCKGLAMGRARISNMVIVGLYFGIFQAGMPLIGYLIGSGFAGSIEFFDHWIAFALLAFIGGRMIWESLRGGDSDSDANADLAFRVMLPLAIATSIDALAVGVTFAFLSVDIVPAVLFIGVTTFAFSAVGMKLGSVFGTLHKTFAEVGGGAILILIGLKILLEHTGIITL